MATETSFGRWLQRRRRALSLTQAELGHRVGLAAESIRKLESDTRRPSHSVADRLATALALSDAERSLFVQCARGERSARHLAGLVLPETARPHVRTTASVSTLPSPLTRLIGRQDEIALVGDLILRSGRRLITLVGTGGIGKTRLALAVAAEVAGAFADGVVFVPLAAVGTPDLVLPALARALGVAGVGVDDSLDRLADVLGEQHRLVVLDNCEHLLGAAPDISALLARVPTLTVLATSRAPLHIAGEHRVPIPPLSLPPRSAAQDPTQLAHSEAVALFQDRAQASDPAFELTPTNAAHIAAICRHLDGLPLAIELAAARSTVLALAELRERLTRRLPLLTSGSRDAPMRHQTLRAAIDWSYRLVPASGQRLFRRLAVFAGGWTLEAAGAVCGSAGDASVLDDLQVLLEHCLITALPELDGRRRYTMLETLREYAFERLAEAAETAQTRDAHARYFLEFVNRVAPEVKGPESARGLARLEQEHANLRAALGWAIEQRQVAPVAEAALTLWIFWWNCGHLAEGQRWLERLAAASDHDAVARARAHACGTAVALLRDDLATVEALAAECLPVLEQADDQPARALALLALGLATNALGRYEHAEALLRESVCLYDTLGDGYGLSLSVPTLAYIPTQQGDYARALELHKAGLAVQRSQGAPHQVAVTLLRMGEALMVLGDYAAAMAHYAEGISLTRALHNPGQLASRLNLAGWTALIQDERATARQLLEESVVETRKTDDLLSLSAHLHSLGVAILLDGDAMRAQALLAESLQLAYDNEWPALVAEDLHAFGLVASRCGAGACAAQLMSAAEHVLTSCAHTLTQQDRVMLDRAAAEAERAMDPAGWAAAWSDGQRLTVDKAVALALGLDLQDRPKGTSEADQVSIRAISPSTAHAIDP